MLKGICVAIVFAPLLALADKTVEVENKAYWMCKSGKQVRTLRVFMKPDGQCTTFYSKAGQEKSVGSGRNHESCHNFLNNIKTNLEKSNWACRDITSTRITVGTLEDKPSP